MDTVDAETNETPARCFKVSRNHHGKLFLDSIEKALANRGLVLLGIGENGFPAHKDGWTFNTFKSSPVQLLVGPKPGMETTYGSEVCVSGCTYFQDTHVRVVGQQSASIRQA